MKHDLLSEATQEMLRAALKAAFNEAKQTSVRECEWRDGDDHGWVARYEIEYFVREELGREEYFKP